MRPAILGTERLLEAVTRSAPSVKRVILLSSFMCISNPTKGSWPGHVYTEDEWNPVSVPLEIRQRVAHMTIPSIDHVSGRVRQQSTRTCV